MPAAATDVRTEPFPRPGLVRLLLAEITFSLDNLRGHVAPSE